MSRPVMLVVLDGFGIGDGGPTDSTAVGLISTGTAVVARMSIKAMGKSRSARISSFG